MTDQTPAPDGLRQQYAQALRDAACDADECADADKCSRTRVQVAVLHVGQIADVCGPVEVITDTVLAVRDRELEQALAERDRYRLARDSARRRVECLLGTLDGTQSNLDSAEAALDRVRALLTRWAGDGPPPPGAPIARWWDTRIRDLTTALADTGQPDAPATDHPTGPQEGSDR